MRRVARAAWAIAVVPLLVASAATPAAAHGTGTYRTTITSMGPHVQGLRVTVTHDGNWVTVANTGPTAVLVLGYEGEPYLRVDASGSWRNSDSPTAALAEAGARASSPAAGPAARAPDWVRLSTRPKVSFHDLRVPATSTRRHLGRSSAPRVITSWSLPLRAGHRAITVRGTLVWQPTPAPTGWILSLSVLGLALFAMLGMAIRREKNQPSQTPESGGDTHRDTGDIHGVSVSWRSHLLDRRIRLPQG